jgi:ABC-2 type transport system permease protein
VTVCTRPCLDRLRAHEHARRTYPGPWLPEPVVADPHRSPEDQIVLELLLRIAATMAIYTVLGVGIGALLRNQVTALAIGYLYFAVLAIPGVTTIYPYLPGGASASLSAFGYLTDAMAQQTGNASRQLLPTPVGALVLLGYALTAAALAVAFPRRRDVT